jgi:4-hydroxy-2-oxoglutarate aldolase
MGNVFPKSTSRVYDLWAAGQKDEARKLQDVVANAEWACKKSLALTKFVAGHFAGKHIGLEDAKTFHSRRPYLPANEKSQRWTIEVMGVLEEEEINIADKVFGKAAVNGSN